MRNPLTWIILGVLLLALSWVGEGMFRVTGVDVIALPKNAYPGDTVTLRVLMINKWGTTAPFRSPVCQWEITEGEAHAHLLERAESTVHLACTTAGDITVRVRVEGMILPVETTVHCMQALALSEELLRGRCSRWFARRGI
jgi:hypothetical protein